VTALRRAFVAVVPPIEVLGWTDELVAAVRAEHDAVRWTRADQRHVTLQFLGAVPDVDALVGPLSTAVRDCAPFSLRLDGAGAFPSARRASVLWLGVGEGADEVARLAADVTDATATVGVAADDRPYRPHLTLARSARSRDVRAVLDQLAVAASPAWTVDEVVLVESDTRADGAVHAARERFPLAAG